MGTVRQLLSTHWQGQCSSTYQVFLVFKYLFLWNWTLSEKEGRLSLFHFLLYINIEADGDDVLTDGRDNGECYEDKNITLEPTGTKPMDPNLWIRILMEMWDWFTNKLTKDAPLQSTVSGHLQNVQGSINCNQSIGHILTLSHTSRTKLGQGDSSYPRTGNVAYLIKYFRHTDVQH